MPPWSRPIGGRAGITPRLSFALSDDIGISPPSLCFPE
jgi:hypothetical protein